ncbi:serine/threonine-protein kinase [Paenibacillus sp. 1P07SE]|uniref:serine/threonine-protein kinase n=1 Tax=Paenibacillus sp. 1P07SE TaxID=3132209 RepID=UPI0039A72EFA
MEDKVQQHQQVGSGGAQAGEPMLSCGSGAAEALLVPGTRIADRYRILSLLGRGGMGAVYAAEDERLDGKLCALKLTRSPLADWEVQQAEAKHLVRLSHPNLPAITDYYPPGSSGCSVLVMDYIEGETLAAWRVQRSSGPSSGELMPIILQLCDALCYLHSQRPPIIHRDLKPANVMISRNGHVKLIDLGIARSYKTGQLQDTMLLGTPGFAAPEQSGTAQSDVRSDVYGLGALIYYLAAGAMYGVSSADSSDPIARLPMPERFQGILSRMLEPYPERRYASMEQVREAWRSCDGAGAGHDSRSPASTARPSGRADGAIAAVPTFGPSVSRSIAVASVASGAGSTFLTLTLARLLAADGVDCAAVEGAGPVPEWHGLLHLDGRSGARLQSGSLPEQRYAHWREGSLSWYALCAAAGSQQTPIGGQRFALMLSGIRAPLLLFDLSEVWSPGERADLAAEADLCLVAADPWPAKWPADRIAAVRRLFERRGSAGRPTMMIANKDLPFAGRDEWLGMLPVPPVTAVPQLPVQEWADCLWRGRWATDDRRWRSRLRAALQPVLAAAASFASERAEI